MAGKTDVEGYVQAPAFRLGGEQTPTRRRCAAEGASVLLEPGVREVLKKIRSKHSRHSGSRNDHGSGENPGPAFGSFFPPEGIDIVAARASFRAGREFFSAVGAGDTVSEFSHSTSLLLENLRLPALDAVHEVRIHAQYESKRATEKTARSVRIARIRFSREKGQKDCPLVMSKGNGGSEVAAFDSPRISDGIQAQFEANVKPRLLRSKSVDRHAVGRRKKKRGSCARVYGPGSMWAKLPGATG